MSHLDIETPRATIHATMYALRLLLILAMLGGNIFMCTDALEWQTSLCVVILAMLGGNVFVCTYVLVWQTGSETVWHC